MAGNVPQRPLRFLRWFCKKEYLDEVEGDLIEAYYQRVRKSPARAGLRLWLEVLGSFNRKNIGIMENHEDVFLVRHFAMLRQYWAIMRRAVANSKVYSAISVLSLTLGITCATLIFLYIHKELSFDRFYSDAGRIYRVAVASETSGRSYGFAPLPLAPYMEESYDAVEETVRIFRYRREVPVTVKRSRESFNEPYFGWADPSFFQVFDIQMLAGDPATALTRPNTVVISESTAKKYFGYDDPVGQVLQYVWEETTDLEVTGVFRDFPTNSHFRFDLLSPIETCERVMWGRPQLNSWQNLFVSAYLKLKKDADVPEVTGHVQTAIDENFVQGSATTISASLQPLTGIHLDSHLDLGEWKQNNEAENLWMFGVVGFIIVCLGCFNFMNMITAQAGQRSKEIGVRKVFGSQRWQIMQQTYFETTVYVAAAMMLSILVSLLALPSLSELTGHVYTYNDLLARSFCLPVAGLWGLVVVLAGTYPALFASRFTPLQLMRGHRTQGSEGRVVRNVLVVAQFVISIGLVISTMVAYLQLGYMRSKDLGFDKSLVVTLPIHNDTAVIPKLDAFKQEAMARPGIKNITAASHEIFADYTYISLFEVQGVDEEFRWERYTVDEDYISTFDLQMVAGRGFSKEFATDTSAFILNEQAVAALGLTPVEAVGRTIESRSEERSGKIVGVVKDFHYRSLHNAIQPFVLYVNYDRLDYISVKLAADEFNTSIDELEAAWTKVFGVGVPFFYSFLDQHAADLYEKEANESKLFTVFSVVSIALGCMGLFGFALFMTERRIREIGIRKVLGASVWKILVMLNSWFLKMVGLAFVLAVPLAYLFADYWLAGFAFRISQPWWVYVVTGGVTVLISMITVSYLSVRASTLNPVEAIRVE